MNFRWLLAPARTLEIESLPRELNILPLIAQCLLNRGLNTPAEISRWLSPKLKNLADPFLIPQMRVAVERLWQARAANETVVIFGDYDVDGVTATALLVEVLTELGWSVRHYLPGRFDEGYGLTREAVENCLAQHPVSLLLAVDCGSTAVETIDYLRTRKVEVLVLDHHQVSTPQPKAVALVNPQLAAADEPSFRELCSVGLAFKLAHALVKHGRELDEPACATFDLKPLLDLVALGTIADLVPLTGENRTLVTAGLERLETTERPGLCALKEVAGVEDGVGVYEVGFQLAPRLNAAGRIENASAALNLILAPDAATALPLARELDARNRERQDIEQGIVEEVIGAIRARFNPEKDFAIVEGQMLWHIGVVGIVASRVLREFYRPTFILGGDGDSWRGSGRSVEGFDMAAALRECDDLLLRHGGHAMAAGVSVAGDRLEAFRERLNRLAQQKLTGELLQPPLRLDAEIRLVEVNLFLMEKLEELQPFGMGNPGVQLVARNVRLARPVQRMGREKQHAKLWVTDGRVTLEAVYWNAKDREFPTGPFDLAFTPQINEFAGRRTLQLKWLDECVVK